MTPKQRRAEYLALIEVAAHAVAIGGVGKLPSAVNDLISHACEIVGGWSGHDPEAPPGSCRLPLVDQTIDRVIARANELRYELVGKLYGTRAEKRERDALPEEMRQTRHEVADLFGRIAANDNALDELYRTRSAGVEQFLAELHARGLDSFS